MPLVSTGALEGAATGLTASVAGGSVRVAVIQFAHGSAKLSARQRKILKNVVALHRSRGGVIRVVGHASRRTREMPSDQHLLANFAMSLERAQAVARELMRLGVKPEDLVIVAKGDSEPIYYEWMPSGEAHNRRAEIYIDT
ncbi:MAG: OmpA family protein [Alphaproteobacteria bacterium]